MRSYAALATLLGVLLLAPATAQEAPPAAAAAEPVAAEPAATTPATTAEVAAAATPTPALATASTSPVLDRADLDAWLDGFLPYALERGDIPGAVVVIVKDGQVLLQRGFGYADVKERKPVDPETTLFRPGSVSKLFTWTAVMQLVEQGKLDLDADVNQYLDFEIPPRDGAPVTLRHILTHTSGLEETARALIISDPAQLPTLEQSLKYWIPTRIFAPGTTPAYSNYATALAGYIVERVSGLSFDDYIDQNLLQPLGMQHSTFRQPLPEALQPLMSKGYKSGSDEPQPYELVGPAPAGSLAASGADMGRFMIAHLADGAFGTARILREETARQMHGTASQLLPPLNSMMLGFYQTDINGHRAIAHGGDTQWFHSDLNLFLDQGIGIFISMNSGGRDGASGVIRNELFERFANRYLPGPIAEGEVDEATAKAHALEVAGRYEVSRRSDTGFVALAGLAGQAQIIANEDGTLSLPMVLGVNGQPRKWREIAPYLWRDVEGNDRLAVKIEDGRVTRFAPEPYAAIMVFEPVPWWKSAGWLLPAFGIGLGALLLTVLAWPVSALVRRYYGTPYKLQGRDARAHRLMRLAALAVVVVSFAYLGFLGTMLSNLELTAPASDTIVRALRLLALVVLPIGALVALWNLGVVWGGRRRWTAKLWALLLALGCLSILWVGVVFSMMGYTANY